MAEQLKHFFNEEVIRSIADALRRAHRRFPQRAFVTACLTGLDALELTARARHIAKAMHECLPTSFPAAAKILSDSLGPELTSTDTFGMAPFHYLPHVFFVQTYGLDDFEAAMQLQYELTKRFSAESSIRAFLVRHPEETYARLREWARDDNVHVRRLVSEGSRPRLPWAPRLPAFQADPRPVIALLEMLRDDPERYVQRSVANNLNDIGKDHPSLAVDICKRWLKDAPPGREWIVRHALRSLVKKGDRAALKVLGVGSRPMVRVEAFRLTPKAVRIGDALRFSFELVSTGEKHQDLLVDYAVHFVKANGSTSRKVFKLKRISLAAATRVELRGSVSFRDMTTRRHYAGRHRLDVLVNGVDYPLVEFMVGPDLRAGTK
jgi:3-methyladenine DNA glycosylase AlkC